MEKIHIPELRSFKKNLSKVLPSLIEFITSDWLQKHKIWGELIPYKIKSYGTKTSLGHCVRPDIVLTEKGPIVCELDFVPSGRGYLLSILEPEEQKIWLKSFADWYKDLETKTKIFYATASTTICDKETELFSEKLRLYHNVDISAINIDEYDKRKVNNSLIDRLFYFSEMRYPDKLTGFNVLTSEPYLDSKMIFAMIHDKNLTKKLTEVLGEESLGFLRQVFPYSVPVSFLKDATLDKIVKNKNKWLLKSCEVESSNSWGCRGTFIGTSYSKTKFRDIILGTREVKNKSIGNRPILQRYHPSKDFSYLWDGIVDGIYKKPKLHLQKPDEKTKHHATKPIGGRFGLYFLINRAEKSCIVPNMGIVTLRADRLVHGASDAFITCCSF